MPYALGHVLLYTSLFLLHAFGWHLYEQPIGQCGANEWKLRVEHLLTMSVPREHGDLSIHDFEPENMAWLERDKNQLKGCLESRTMLAFGNSRENETLTDFAEWAKRSERTLPGLVQFHGRHQRLWGVNGQIPSPTLVAREGSEVLLRLKNRLLLDSFSLRLHGLQGHWYNGGVAQLQQCPLAVRSDFTLRFRAQPAGTHWYHADWHQSTGLAGAFIVLPEESGKEDRDFVALLQDWPLVDTAEQEANWADGISQLAGGWHGEMDKGNGTLDGQRPGDGLWSILVNQKGWHSREEIVEKPEKIPWTRFPVGKDELLRLRLVHAGFRHPLVVHIEGHQMELVAADGGELEPRKLDALILYPGERYDVHLHTLHQPKRHVYSMVVGLAEQLLASIDSLGQSIYGLAQLEYDDGNGAGMEGGNGQNRAVDFGMAKCALKQCTLVGCPFQGAFRSGDGRNFTCIPVEELRRTNDGGQSKNGSVDGNAAVDEKHVIAIDPERRTVDGFNFQMPDSSTIGPFFSAGVDQMLKLLTTSNCSACTPKPCACFYHKRFAMGSRVQITFVHQNAYNDNNSSKSIADLFRQSFAVHLQGIRFDLIKMGFPEMDSSGKVKRNLALANCTENREECGQFTGDFESNGREVQKDTVVVPSGGYTVIRFMADNPGWWLAETQQNGHGSVKFAFAIGNEEEKPRVPSGFPADCGTFEPGLGVYEQFGE